METADPVPEAGRFFRIRKNLVLGPQWRALPSSSKVIFPVIGRFCNKQGQAFPSQGKIADLAGCDLKTVRGGMRGLTKLKGFEAQRYVTNRGKLAYRYKLPLPTRHEPGTIFFYHAIVDDLTWADLTPNGKLVYLALRASAYPNTEWARQIFYEQTGGDRYEFALRSLDYSEAEEDALAYVSGISKSRAKMGLDELEESKIIMPDGYGWFVSTRGKFPAK